MPFDNTNFVEVSEEIVVLDKMAEILATPERWCQKDLVKTLDGVIATQFCIIGAMHAAVHDTKHVETLHKQEWTVVSKKICGFMQPKGFESVPQFNDAKTTTHQDVLNLIARTRASFL